MPSIEDRASFGLIRYANCWEDADVLCAALRPAAGKRFLSIASGGDNSFALAAEGAEVVAADLSAAQLALVELKASTIKHLGHSEALAFLGVRPSDERLRTFEKLKPGLSVAARSFWEKRPRALATGVIHQGKFESYFRLFRQRLLPLVHSRRTITRLLEERDPQERHDFYRREWDNLRWRLLFRLFFSRFVMGRLGRDPEFFRYVEGSVATRILERTRYALTELPTHENPYLEYILTGNFGRTLPRFLRPGPFVALKERVDRVTLYHGPVQEAARSLARDGFDGFNLSDIFEYLDSDTCRSIYASLLDAARAGARFAYWNMLVPRSCPDELADRVRPLREEADRLFAQDLAFFYSAFRLEGVMA